MSLILSSKLLDYLKIIDNPAKNLLVQAKEAPINYIDISEADDGIKLSYLEKVKTKEISSGSNHWTSSLRRVAKVGRVLNKLNTGSVAEADIRSFAESLSAYASTSAYRVELVEGPEIGRIYRLPKSDTVNPKHVRPFGSCFQSTLTKAQCEFWDINPDIVKMIVAWCADKLAGRALVWYGKFEDKEAILLDNVYHGMPQAEVLINKKAKEIGAKPRYSWPPVGKWQAQGKIAGMPNYFDWVEHVGGGLIKEK